MGTGALDTFGNDDACDWAYELLESRDLSIVENALEKVSAAGGVYLESTEATEGFAAAETVA